MDCIVGIYCTLYSFLVFMSSRIRNLQPVNNNAGLQIMGAELILGRLSTTLQSMWDTDPTCAQPRYNKPFGSHVKKIVEKKI